MNYRVLKEMVKAIERLAPRQTLDNAEELTKEAVVMVLRGCKGAANVTFAKEELSKVFKYDDLSAVAKFSEVHKETAARRAEFRTLLRAEAEKMFDGDHVFYGDEDEIVTRAERALDAAGLL